MLSLLMSFICASFALSSENTYQLNLQLKMRGEPVNLQNKIVQEGKKTTWVQQHHGKTVIIDVLAKENEILADERATVKMDFTISEVKPGVGKTVLSNPSIITIENEQASIAQSDEHGKEDFSVTVKPEIINQ